MLSSVRNNGSCRSRLDDGGSVKYWQPNMNNVKLISKAHKEPVRGVSFAPTDLKFCTGGDDTLVKVWDFARAEEECSMIGHGSDVKGLPTIAEGLQFVSSSTAV